MKKLVTAYEDFKKAFPTAGNGCRIIHEWFGLTYASYLVLPRTLMEHMPEEWQEKMKALLDEATEIWEHDDKYTVLLRDKKGKFKDDPLRHYRHPDYTALKEALKSYKISVRATGEQTDPLDIGYP